jgi:6-pyruvoyltetrahydropterin/6-carboxytetrahydropterin synthase
METTGWVADFGGHVKAAGNMIVNMIDHQFLNDIKGLENPTAENLAIWIFDRVARVGMPRDVLLSAVEVQETCSAGVRYP